MRILYRPPPSRYVRCVLRTTVHTCSRTMGLHAAPPTLHSRVTSPGSDAPAVAGRPRANAASIKTRDISISFRGSCEFLHVSAYVKLSLPRSLARPRAICARRPFIHHLRAPVIHAERPVVQSPRIRTRSDAVRRLCDISSVL